jgi:hypothetical protein
MNMAHLKILMRVTLTHWFSQKTHFLKSNKRILIILSFYNRVIELTSKENGIEDCLVALKKGYEKDVLTLNEFLAVS